MGGGQTGWQGYHSPAVSLSCPYLAGDTHTAVSQPVSLPRQPPAPPGLKLVLPGSSVPFMSALAPSAVSSPPQTSLTTWCCLTSPSHLEVFPGQGSPGE